jgi:hypothetical protein
VTDPINVWTLYNESILQAGGGKSGMLCYPRQHFGTGILKRLFMFEKEIEFHEENKPALERNIPASRLLYPETR